MSSIPPPSVGSGSSATGNYGASEVSRPRGFNDFGFAADAEKLKSLVMTTAIQDELQNILTGRLFGGSGAEGPNESMVEALTQVRDQEKHQAEMAMFRKNWLKTEEDIRGTQLKNEKTQMEMDIKLAEANQKGLAVPTQDPKPIPIPGQEPTSGRVASQLMQADHGMNLTKGLFEAINSKYADLVNKGLEKPLDSEEARRFDFYQDELQRTLGKLETEKKLQYGPFADAGPIGNLITVGAGLLDVITGPLDLGTELFGGTIGAAGKVELLTRAMSNTSPLLRAQMQDMFNRDKMEQTAHRYLEARGLGSLRSNVSASDVEGADQLAKIAIDIRQTLATNEVTKNSFGSDSVLDLGDSFSAFENVHAYLDELRYATTREEVIAIKEKIVAADNDMREPYRRFLANGGKPEDWHNQIVAATNAINERYQQPITFSPLMSKEELNYRSKQGVVANDFTRKLADLETALIGQTDLDIDENVKRRLKPSDYKRYEELKTKGMSQEGAALEAVAESRRAESSEKAKDKTPEEYYKEQLKKLKAGPFDLGPYK